MAPGRIARTIQWIPVSYNNMNYVVGKIKYNDAHVYCVIDSLDIETIQTHPWHVVGSGLGYEIGHDGKRKAVFMQNILLNPQSDDNIIDHINGIELDNRRANLREVIPAYQRLTSKQRSRNVERLPVGIHESEIPRNIWYIPAKDLHGDRFAVEFKGIPGVGDICRKTTSAKGVSARDKLNQAIAIREELFETYPVLSEYSRESNKAVQLKREYENIVAIAKGEPLIHDSVIPVLQKPVNIVKSDVKDILETMHAGNRIEHILSTAEPTQPTASTASTPTLPKQWKTRDIYDFLQANQEHHYKQYCEANNDMSKLPTWSEDWSRFVALKGQPWAIAESQIRAFVDNLRRIRQQELHKLTKKDILEREDRQVWPAETVATLFLAGRIADYKTVTETATGDDPANVKWAKRWGDFVGTLETLRNDKTALTKEISKFMASQRAKKYRRAKA